MKTFLRSPLRCVAPGMALALALFAAGVARADFIVTMTQVGSNVVATRSGALDVSDLPYAGPEVSIAFLIPDMAFINLGPTVAGDDVYLRIVGPASFGTGSAILESSGSGDAVGIAGALNELSVPAGYTSGSPLSATTTYDHATFSSLGVTPGTYKWTWGSAPNEKFILDVVPEPSSFLPVTVILLVWLGVSLARRRSRAGSRTPASIA
jgi:hypothetical protein